MLNHSKWNMTKKQFYKCSHSAVTNSLTKLSNHKFTCWDQISKNSFVNWVCGYPTINNIAFPYSKNFFEAILIPYQMVTTLLSLPWNILLQEEVQWFQPSWHFVPHLHEFQSVWKLRYTKKQWFVPKKCLSSWALLTPPNFPDFGKKSNGTINLSFITILLSPDQ